MTDINYTDYCELCRQAVADPAVFATFRQRPEYTRILEHVTPEQGIEYAKCVSSGEFRPDVWQTNDSIGSPVRQEYLQAGRVSPTTLRYAKNVSDIAWFFGDLNGARIVEVGGGYGGLARLVKARWPSSDYTIIDLPEPLALAQKYLHTLGTEAHLVNAFELPQKIEADLFISNYALSELPPDVIKLYVSRVAMNCPRGYISANAAADLLPGLFGPLGVQRYPEVPLTGPNNYMLFWGIPRSFGGLPDETEMPPLGTTFEPYSVPLHLLKKAAATSTMFIETGFYRGLSTSVARAVFDTVISVEISESLWRQGVERFADVSGVHILHGDSGALLPGILAGLEGRRATLWLDAHYSGGKTSAGATSTAIRAEMEGLIGAPRPNHTPFIH